MSMGPEIEALRQRNAPLAMQPGEFREIGHRLVDHIADRLATLPDGPVTHAESPVDLRRILGVEQALPVSGTDAGTLLTDATRRLFDHSLFNGHPRFFGYITSSPAPIGMFGDFLAAALNQNVGAWQLSPLATEIEGQTVRWIAELIGYPQDCGGLLVSGGNMANYVGFLAARAARAPGDTRKAGLSRDGGFLVAYTSAETHGWIKKAADLFGLGTDAIRWIATDDERRMDPSALRLRVEEDRRLGHHPFLAIGTAGTVGTGAVDPLPEIAAVCREHGLWFHVDGAYGALAAQVAGSPASLLALSDADSIAVDPHKWLYAPLEAGCVLVRDAENLRRAFSHHASYYHFDDDVVNYFDCGLQNSRGFRALKVWLALRHVGRAGYLKMIGDDMLLARHLHALVARHPDLEATSQSLSITTFRYVPADLRPQLGSEEVETYLDELNRRVLTAVEQCGDAFLSNAAIGGRFVLRACIVNFHTSLGDIEALPPLISRLGQEADTALRHPSSMHRASRGVPDTNADATGW
ncbi:MAG TPA: aminotransferase class V-fold PLP-dependent enzyme [Vicinamibacterales bacterium]|nr:aminotransferase class V-fold PLP-dependent enzyme [Vicinamibacterales bacterium]